MCLQIKSLFHINFCGELKKIFHEQLSNHTLCILNFLASKLLIQIHTNPQKNTHTFSFEPRHEKTNVLHMRKQRRRSASR